MDAETAQQLIEQLNGIKWALWFIFAAVLMS